MRVAVIDDTCTDRQVMLEALERFEKEEQVALTIHTFENAERFLETYEEVCPELVILDIDMPGLNGMEAAHRIREKDENVSLLFVTNVMHYALEGYAVDALDYLIKPVQYEALVLRLQKARRYIARNRDERISLRAAGGMVTLQTSEIYYVESMLHYLNWHTRQGEYRVRESMSKAEQRLKDSSFASCNKSFLVNLRYVEAIQKDEVTVAGTALKISRGKKAEFINRYTRYLGGMRL